jgi:tetratricopeptide (TPR) repeat protein
VRRSLAALLLVLTLGAPARAFADGADSPLPYYLDAVARREAGDLDGAVASLEAARRLAPTDPDLALELARAYDADHRYGDAAAAFAEASGLAPDRADLAVARARFHLDHLFRVRDGLEAAELAVRLAPEDPAATALLDRARTLAGLATWPGG